MHRRTVTIATLATFFWLVATVAAGSEIEDNFATVNVTVNADCSYSWSLTNHHQQHRAYIVDSNDSRTSVLSAGAGETSVPWSSGPNVQSAGKTYNYSTYWAEVWWLNLAGDIVEQSEITKAATVLPECKGGTTTTTTIPSTTLPGGGAPTTSPGPPLVTHPPPVIGEPLGPLTLPNTGLESDLAWIAFAFIVFGAGTLWLASHQERLARRHSRAWR